MNIGSGEWTLLTLATGPKGTATGPSVDGADSGSEQDESDETD
ncbi:hypothetical protein [Streptomyces mirabilis]